MNLQARTQRPALPPGPVREVNAAPATAFASRRLLQETRRLIYKKLSDRFDRLAKGEGCS